MDLWIKFVSFAANFFSIITSGIVIYLFIFKRKSIKSVFRLLVNYSYQLTLSELKEKIEKLNDYNVKNSDECEQVINILNDIMGQIKGNNKLNKHLSPTLASIEKLTSDKRRLTEPRKRAFVSELRERVRHLNVENIDNLVGENNE